VVIKLGPPLRADSSITNAELVRVLVAGSVIQAYISILRIPFQCIDKHSSLLKQLYEWLGIERGKVA
jgi:hypothetical protein